MFRFRLLFALIGALACLTTAGSMEWFFRRIHLAAKLDDRASPVLIMRSDRTQFLERAGGQRGDVQITLAWNNRNDLDLSCIDPNNEPIYFQHLRARSGGELDVDSNNSHKPLVDNPVEHIFWPYGRAPYGKYSVYVSVFYKYGNLDPTPFTVTIWEKGRLHEVRGSIAFTGVKKPAVEGYYAFTDLNALKVLEFDTSDTEYGWTLLLPTILRAMLITGLWITLMGALFTAAVWMGQAVFFRRFYKQRRLKLSGVGLMMGWGALSGLLAGLAGQLVFSLLTVALPVLPITIGCYLGWVLMGGLFGWLISLRMPNLPSVLALIGGILSGWLGGLVYLMSLLDGSGAEGRVEGAVLLGALLGLMITLYLPYEEYVEPLQDRQMGITAQRLRSQRSSAVGRLKRYTNGA